MATRIEFETNRTYVSEANAIKAVEKIYPPDQDLNLRYFIMTNKEGRYFPVFVGQSALQHMVHFHFNVVM